MNLKIPSAKCRSFCLGINVMIWLFEYSQLLAEVSQQRKIRKSDLDSIVGKLNFASSVIPAKPYLRRLINLGIGVKKTYYFVQLTKHTKADMAIWLQFLEQYNGITFFQADWIHGI